MKQFAKVNLGTDFISGPESKVEVFNSKTNRWTPNTKLVQQQEKFHLVSMQFAFHYMMQSEERLRRFFESFTPICFQYQICKRKEWFCTLVLEAESQCLWYLARLSVITLVTFTQKLPTSRD